MFRNLKESRHNLTTCEQPSYLARELMSTQVCSAALIVLPPGVLQKGIIMSIKKMLSVLRKACVKHEANINFKKRLLVRFITICVILNKKEITEGGKPGGAAKQNHPPPPLPHCSKFGSTNGLFAIFSCNFCQCSSLTL